MLLEIEAENKLLIENFYLERMRPRDLAQFLEPEAQQAPQATLEEEANAI